jgi:hypothetical protein
MLLEPYARQFVVRRDAEQQRFAVLLILMLIHREKKILFVFWKVAEVAAWAVAVGKQLRGQPNCCYC